MKFNNHSKSMQISYTLSPKTIVTPQNDLKNNLTKILVSERSLEKDQSTQNITISKISPIPHKLQQLSRIPSSFYDQDYYKHTHSPSVEYGNKNQTNQLEQKLQLTKQQLDELNQQYINQQNLNSQLLEKRKQQDQRLQKLLEENDKLSNLLKEKEKKNYILNANNQQLQKQIQSINKDKDKKVLREVSKEKLNVSQNENKLYLQVKQLERQLTDCNTKIYKLVDSNTQLSQVLEDRVKQIQDLQEILENQQNNDKSQFPSISEKISPRNNEESISIKNTIEFLNKQLQNQNLQINKLLNEKNGFQQELQFQQKIQSHLQELNRKQEIEIQQLQNHIISQQQNYLEEKESFSQSKFLNQSYQDKLSLNGNEQVDQLKNEISFLQNQLIEKETQIYHLVKDNENSENRHQLTTTTDMDYYQQANTLYSENLQYKEQIKKLQNQNKEYLQQIQSIYLSYQECQKQVYLQQTQISQQNQKIDEIMKCHDNKENFYFAELKKIQSQRILKSSLEEISLFREDSSPFKDLNLQNFYIGVENKHKNSFTNLICEKQLK